MIRIAFVITGLEVGGAETMLLKLVSNLPGSGFETTVISLRSGGPMAEEFRAAGVTVVELDSDGALGMAGSLLRLRKIARDLRPAVIQGWMYHGNLGAWVMHRALGSRPALLWSIRITADSLAHEKALTKKVMRLGARLSKRADRIIYNSAKAQAQHEELGYDRSGSVVVPNGFDTDRFSPSAEHRAATRKRFGIAEHAPVVGIVGRYHAIKDHRTFLEAARLVSDALPEVRFLMVGQGVEAATSELMANVRQLKLEQACILAGRQGHPEALYPAMDVHVSSSVAEGFPNVLGEAMSCGVPCVTTDAGDSATIVAETGVVVPPGDAATLAQGILGLLAETAKARHERSEAARQRVIDQYAMPEIVRQYQAIYEGSARESGSAFATVRPLVCDADKQ